jgi:hypothetical protein
MKNSGEQHDKDGQESGRASTMVKNAGNRKIAPKTK